MTVGAVALVVAGAVVALVMTTPSPTPTPGWEPTGQLPDPRGEVASTVVEGSRLVVAGGLEGVGATSAAVHELDADSGTWRHLPDLPEPRHHPAAAAIDGDVYLSGGAPSVTDWAPQDSLWVLRDDAEQWEELADLPEGRDSHRMRAHEGHLYIVGGHGDTADTLVYDPAEDRWERAAPLPQPRHHLAVVVFEAELWALGGRDDDDTVLDAVHVWDPEADAWRDGPALPRPVSAAVEGVVDGRIHLVGGEDPAIVGGGIVDDHHALDPETQTWTREPAAPVSVHGAGGGELDGRLLVAGGAMRQGALSVLTWTDFAAAYEPE